MKVSSAPVTSFYTNHTYPLKHEEDWKACIAAPGLVSNGLCRRGL